MYYCIATVKIRGTTCCAKARGPNKGEVLKRILEGTKGDIIFLEELTKEEYDILRSNVMSDVNIEYLND